MAGAIARGEPAVSGPPRGDAGSSGASRPWRRLWAVAGALVSLAATLPEARAEGGEPYRELFFRGGELVKAGRLDAGCPMLAESFRQKPLPGTLFALADCEDRRGKTASALAHYEEYLLRFELMTREQKASQRGRDKFAAARKAVLEPTVPRLLIRVTTPAAPGAVIKLDGRPLPAASLAAPIRVDPGQHEIRAQALGGRETVLSVQIEAGELMTVPLSINAERDPVRADQSGTSNGSGSVGYGPWVLGLGAGVSAVSIGAGIALTVAAQGKYAEAEHIGGTLGDGSKTYCARPANRSSDVCARLKSAVVAGDDYQNLGTASFVVGGAVLAGTVLYYVLSPSKQEQRAAARVLPVITASQGGIHVAGQF